MGGPPLLAAVLALMLFAAPARGQEPIPLEDAVAITAYAGFSAFSDLRRDNLRFRELGAEGEILAERVVRRRLMLDDAPVYGASVVYWFSRNWGARAHVSYASTEVDAGVEADGAGDVPSEGIVSGVLTGASVRLFDADVVFRAPTVVPVLTPYGLLGLGVVRYRFDEPLATVLREAGAGGDGTEVAGVVGVGTYVPIGSRRFALTVEVTDHISGSPLPEAPGGELVRTPRLVVEREPEDQMPLDDADVGVVNHFRITAGLTVTFGGSE